MSRRKTPEDYHALAESRGYQWLGPEVTSTGLKTTWECPQGHRWQARYNSLLQGSGCPVCAGRAPKTPDDYYSLAEERGFRWLGPEVPNIRTKTTWECEQGHRWRSTFHNIRFGSGCPYCAGNRPKTPDDYRALAQERGFRWLGPMPPNTQTNTGWECDQGHRWLARYARIYQGTGCPYCAGLAPKTPDDYHTLAEEKGFRWLGPMPQNTQTETTWECAEGHRFELTHNEVRLRLNCPVCARQAKDQDR